MEQVIIKMWDNKKQSYSLDVECDVLLSSFKFDRLKSTYECSNGAYLISLVDDSGEIDMFYSEDIDFL